MEDKDLELKQCECEQDEITKEDLLELFSNPPLVLDVENLSEVQLDEDKFKKGVCDISEVCGRLSALMSIGMNNSEAVDILLNQMNIDYNLQLTKLNNQTQVEISKYQSLQAEKSMI